MSPHQFMHQHHIVDGQERFSEAIPRNVNIYKSELDYVEKPGTVWMVSAGFFDTIQSAL